MGDLEAAGAVREEIKGRKSRTEKKKLRRQRMTLESIGIESGPLINSKRAMKDSLLTRIKMDSILGTRWHSLSKSGSICSG